MNSGWKKNPWARLPAEFEKWNKGHYQTAQRRAENTAIIEDRYDSIRCLLRHKNLANRTSTTPFSFISCHTRLAPIPSYSSPATYTYSSSNMPIRTLFPQQRKLHDIMGIVKTRSSDSTVDVNEDTAKKSLSIPIPFLRSSSPPTNKQQQSWRKKDVSSPFLSARLNASSQQEDMWMIRRCDAFDEDDSDDEY